MKLKKKDNPKYDLATCGCGVFEVNRGFRVGQDFIFIDPCKKCNSRGVMIPIETWRRMRQKKFYGKAVSANGEVSNF